MGTRKASETYFEPAKCFPLRPIRSERDLDRAQATIDDLIDRARLDAGEDDYLDVLSDLVEKYEEKHYPMGHASDSAMLKHLIEAKEVTQRAVALATGIPVSTICEIVAGKRQVSRANIGKLAKYFQVSPAVFTFDK